MISSQNINSCFLDCHVRSENIDRKLVKNKPFDPLSVDNVDVVDDWAMEKSEMFSADDDSSWKALELYASNEFLSHNVCDEDVESFIMGIVSLFPH